MSQVIWNDNIVNFLEIIRMKNQTQICQLVENRTIVYEHHSVPSD